MSRPRLCAPRCEQETPLERKKQNDAAPREFATMPDPEEIKVIGAGGPAAQTRV